MARLLLAFVTVCVALVATGIWLLLQWRYEAAQPYAAPLPHHRRLLLERREKDALQPPAAAALDEAGPAAESAPGPGSDTRPAETGAATRPSEPPAPGPVRRPEDPDVARAALDLAAARAVLAADPDHEPALRDEIAALTTLRRWNELPDRLGRLARLRPDDADVHFDWAAALLHVRRYVEAVHVLEQLAERRADDPRVWFNLAVAHQALGHLERACRAWDRAVALAPTPAARARRAEVLLDLGEWAAALDDLTAALAATPGDPDLAANAALALTQLGRFEAARDVLLEVLTQRPRHVPTLNRLVRLAADAAAVAADDDTAAAWRQSGCEWAERSLAVDAAQPELREWLAAQRE